MSPISSPAQIAASLTELWSPRVIAELDDSYIKVAKVRGSLAWHSHEHEDELFMVHKGYLRIEMDTGVALVNVSYARSGPWIIVSVRDHGPGVAPEKLARLTTPFYRGDAARTAATGAGLGLAIVEKAIQRMGGQFDIDNAPDGGLLAHIRLKRVP